ncbi:MAG TPA: hypothetical protein VFZ47_00480 [Chitinophagaceae bacterium]
MKKQFISTILVAVLISLNGYTQDYNNKMRPQGVSDINAITFDETLAKPADPLRKNEISMKALRAFTKEHKNVNDARWHKGNDWFAAYFTRNNIQVKVFYDSWGNNRYTLRSYQESNLPKDVRHQVKSTHYDYNIFYVNEVNVRGTVIYFIKLEGKNSWMDVRIVDNEMATIQEYTKAK